MRIILNINLWLIALSVFAIYETANAQEDLLKKYYGNYKYSQSQTIKIKAIDARGEIDSVEIILDTNATFNLDSNLGEVNIIDIPKKDLDLRLVRKSKVQRYLPNDKDTLKNIKCWTAKTFNSAIICSEKDIELKTEYHPTFDFYLNSKIGIPNLNIALNLEAKYYPVELYVTNNTVDMHIYEFILQDKFNSSIHKYEAFSMPSPMHLEKNEKFVIRAISDSLSNSFYIGIINFDWIDGIGVDEEYASNMIKAIELIPQNGFLSIENKDYTLKSPLQLKLIDINSNVIREIIFNNVIDNYQIEVDDLPNGVYFLYSEELKKYYKFKIGKGE